MSRVFEEVDPAYAEACSDVTLCSSSKGFFRGLAEEVVSLVEGSSWMQNFQPLSDSAKLAAVTQHKELMSMLSEVWSRIEPLRRGKDARVSHERVMRAQEALERGDVPAAFALACQAVLRAPMTGNDESLDGGVSLALALWCRSEVLMRRGNPQAALVDLKRALKERLPAAMRGKYYTRMGDAYKEAGEPTRAKVSYELAARLLRTDEMACAQLARAIAALDLTAQPRLPQKPSGITLTGGAKPNMPALSTLVKVTEQENKGRFVVSNCAINTGDVLLFDTPYAACLLPEYFGDHCLHCFKRLDVCEEEAPMWCPECSAVAFCCTQCRDVALTSYHQFECHHLDLLIGSGMSILSHIALRMVTQAGLDTSLTIHAKYLSNDNVKTVELTAVNDIEGSAKKSKMKTRKERLNRAKKGMKTLNNKKDDDEDLNKEDKANFDDNLELKAAQIYNLCTHSELRKGSDHVKRIVMAMFLTEILKKAGFFKKCSVDEISKAETSICELIIRNLQLLQFNAHEIYETVCGAHPISGSKPLYIAVGIYPTGALFNHECYPAITRYFEGRKLVLRATRPLSPGEVVSENYGPNFLVRTRMERQRSLASRYWFRCSCAACIEDWPMLKQMSSSEPLYLRGVLIHRNCLLRCPNQGCTFRFRGTAQPPARCGRCSVAIDRELVKVFLQTVTTCVEQYQEGARLIDEGRIPEAIETLTAAVDRFHEVAMAPHHDTHIAQEALRSCFATAGNIHRVETETNTTVTEDKNENNNNNIKINSELKAIDIKETNETMTKNFATDNQVPIKETKGKQMNGNTEEPANDSKKSNSQSVKDNVVTVLA